MVTVAENPNFIVRGHGSVMRVVLHKNLRDANLQFVSLAMQIRQAFSVTDVCELAKSVIYTMK